MEFQKDYSDPESNATFRYGFVFKPQFDFSNLRRHVERIIYASDGYSDHVDRIREQLEENFDRFDPKRDVIVPAGQATINFMAGEILRRKLGGMEGVDGYYIAFFLEGDYKFWRVPLSPLQESYEVIIPKEEWRDSGMRGSSLYY